MRRLIAELRQHFIGREPEAAQATLEDPLALGRVLKQTLCLGPCLIVLDSVHLVRTSAGGHATWEGLDWLPAAHELHPVT